MPATPADETPDRLSATRCAGVRLEARRPVPCEAGEVIPNGMIRVPAGRVAHHVFEKLSRRVEPELVQFEEERADTGV
jgi:hypothetical protein